MGWNVFYKECKYVAAHQMLKFLRTKYQKHIHRNPDNTHINFDEIEPTYRLVELNEVKEKLIIFPLDMIKEVAYMLYDSSPYDEKKEAIVYANNNIGKITIKITEEGINSLKDRKYWRLFFGSVKIIIPLLSGIIYMIIDLGKKLI